MADTQSFDENAGTNKLANVLCDRMKREGETPLALDFGEILFLSRMKILCGDKICIIGKYPYHEGVYQGIDMKISQQFLFTENMLFTSGLRKMIEVRNESRTKV